MKKTFIIILVLVVIVLVSIGAFFYYGSFSEGTRAGTVVKVSKRGTVFKTYEGQLNMESFGAVDNKKQLNEIFEFSIDKDKDSIFTLLQEVALTGERVNLRYKEKFLTVPWRGDTKYFVNGVDRLNNGKSNEAPEKKKEEKEIRLFD